MNTFLIPMERESESFLGCSDIPFVGLSSILFLKVFFRFYSSFNNSFYCALLMHLHQALSSHLVLSARLLCLRKTHELTLIILPKIILAGFQDLRSPACVAELSWAYGRVIHHVLGYR